MNPIAATARWALRSWARSRVAPGYFYQAMEAYGPRLAGKAPLAGRLPGGARVECDLRDHVQRHIYFQNVYEPVEAFLFATLVQPGFTVVDAGANVGQYSLLASRAVGPTGRVHAFEPVPRNYERLARHLNANGAANVTAHRAGLWHEPSTIHLGLGAEFAGNNDGSFSVGFRGDVAAPAVRLDDVGIGRVDAIKMDVEGAEWSALQGMARTLEAHRPLLLMEVNRAACARLDYAPDVFWDRLCGELGYAAWVVGGSARAWAKAERPPDLPQANVLFCPADLPPAVADGWDLKSCLKWAQA